MFTAEMSESKQETVRLQDVEPEMIRYTNRILRRNSQATGC